MLIVAVCLEVIESGHSLSFGLCCRTVEGEQFWWTVWCYHVA